LINQYLKLRFFELFFWGNLLPIDGLEPYKLDILDASQSAEVISNLGPIGPILPDTAE
jgi:hypothetical protein